MVLFLPGNGRILLRWPSQGLKGRPDPFCASCIAEGLFWAGTPRKRGAFTPARRHKHTGPNGTDQPPRDGHAGPGGGPKGSDFSAQRKIVNYLDYNARFLNSAHTRPGYPWNRGAKNRKGGWFGRSGGEAEADSSTGYGLVVLFVAMFGVSFACVPLYEYFCQKTGYLGTTKRTKTYPLPSEASDQGLRKFEIDFVTHSNLDWEFKPSQRKVVVRPGETTLSFYTAKNLTDRPIIGVAAYHVIPDEAGLYFNKIQCFCFEEQLLNPGEEVDLPVLFFLDPAIVKDKKLHGVDKITLSYIFFEANSEIPPEYTLLFK